MRLTSNALSPEEIERIHADSLRILAELGVRVPSEKVLGLLQAQGARVDWDRQRVQFPESMIADALRAAPRSFVLGARNPVHDVFLPAAETVLNMDGAGSYTIDLQTGETRDAVLQDIADAAKIFEQIETARVFWSPVVPRDVSASSSGVLSSATAFLHTTKHIQDEVKEMAEVPYLVEIQKAILGSRR